MIEGPTSEKILQITPADGWTAEYEIDGKREIWPVAVWALIEWRDEDTGELEQEIIGMNHVANYPHLCRIDAEGGGFRAYRGPRQPIEKE